MLTAITAYSIDKEILLIFNYFGAARYTNNATTVNNIFGIHTANNGLMPPLVAKTVENCINNMYEKLINNPNPKWNPIPPRILREAIHTPINVNINYRSTAPGYNNTPRFRGVLKILCIVLLADQPFTAPLVIPSTR